MKAVRLIKPGQPLEMQEVPVSPVGEKDVLVKVKAAGICRSDMHYRAGTSPVHPLPLTLGHEVAGVIEEVGAAVRNVEVSDRVCLHYLVTCGDCRYCTTGSEQFCTTCSMIGKYQDGGYAEYIAVPSHNAVPLPDDIPFEQGAIMMCSSATSLHALHKAELKPGESVAVFGAGGLGMSALLTTTMPGMKAIIEALEEAGLRDAVKIMVGGAPVTAAFAEQIGADAYAPDAATAVDVARSLVA